MRLVLKGKLDVDNIGEVISDAFSNALDILKEESTELYNEIEDNVTEIYMPEITLDVVFKLENKEEPLVLTAEHHGRDEMLTFIYDIDENSVPSLTKYNNDDSGQPSLFSDNAQAIMDIVNGTCKTIESTIDVTDVPMIVSGKAGGLDIEIYENRCIKFYQNGNLIGEDIIADEIFEDVIESYIQMFVEESEDEE